jgi:hypothetical protein
MHPVRYTKIAPFLAVGGSSLLPKDFVYSTVNASPTPAGSGGTSGQSGNPSTPGGTAQSSPTPATPAQPFSYSIYTFTPTITSSVAQVTQLRSIVLSLTYYMAHWTFGIWIPSIQRYTEFIPSAQTPPDNWSTTNASINIEASGTAQVEFIFGLLVDPTMITEPLTAPYGSIQVNNYEVSEYLFIGGVGGGGGGGGGARVTQVPDEATATTYSQNNPTNFYFWVS